MKYFFVIFLLMLTNCGGSSSSNGDNDQKLEAKIIFRDTFSQESNSFIQGENIEIFLVLINNSTSAATLNFNSGQQYDFYISSLTNTEVWRWSADKIFTTAVTELIVEAGESIEISEVWDQTLASSETISIGSYSVFGSFLDQSQEVQFDFTIQ